MKHRRQHKRVNTPRKESVFFTKSTDEVGGHTKSGSFFHGMLTVNRPGDGFEQEADAMADAVVNQASNASPTTAQRKEVIQRQAAEKEEEIAAPKLQRQAMEEEEEAAPKLQRQEMEEEEEAAPKLQRQEMEEEEAAPTLQRQAEEEEEPVQTKAENTAPSIPSRLRSNRGKGSPLPPKTRSEMEGAFGADFSGVRIHTDEEAVQMNQQLNAQAFTNGQDIYFNKGKFGPASGSGKHLLAHELTHVVQQGKKKD